MKVYVLRASVCVDADKLPDLDNADPHAVVDALRDAADEMEDAIDWMQRRDGHGFVEVPDGNVTDGAVADAVAASEGFKYLKVTDVNWTDWEFITLDFPNWALCTLVNGDPLESDEDKRAYDAWEAEMKEHGYSLLNFDVLDDTNDFCPYPAFGLACDTTRVRFFKKRGNGNE